MKNSQFTVLLLAIATVDVNVSGVPDSPWWVPTVMIVVTMFIWLGLRWFLSFMDEW
jgi:hypothetical protein